MVQSKDVPTGDDYGSWTWKQIKAAVNGGSEEHGGEAARTANANPQSFFDAGNKFAKLARVFELCRDTVQVHAKAIAGPDGPWKGPAAEGFRNAMDYYGKVFGAHVERVNKPPFGGTASLPRSIVDAGNKLNAAQYQLEAIDSWYADQAVKLGAPKMENGLIQVSAKPEVVKMLDQDMRKVIKDLAGEYSVKVRDFDAPVPKSPDEIKPPPGGGPDGITPPQFPPPGGGGSPQNFPGFGGAGPGGEPSPFPGGDGSGGPIPYPGATGSGGPGPYPGGVPAPLSPGDLGLKPDPYDPGTGLAGAAPATYPGGGVTTPPGAGLTPYVPGGGGPVPGGAGLVPYSGGLPGGLTPYAGGKPGGGLGPNPGGKPPGGGLSPYPGGGAMPRGGAGGVKPYGAGGASLSGGGVKPYGVGASGAGAAGQGGMTGAGTGKGGSGVGGMPMGAGAPGAAGQGERERERTTWLVEDEDVWGANPDAPPGVIGRPG
ncbi:hypothetical protein ACFWY9_12985 [Amycolatopsis sp. NPDC059027]|uniref:hypothetical protein n=1 Tax=Amycolatopsis sp. NPDC059027 TaxID=3346709 RepID=UPI00366AA851